ncbi:MAG TPA: polysaccharide deacetylase family protein, partial [Thermomicrobiaceae bacterium]|nr:polysaccharide deacetylase family protein [Thermomicrobiaceae bacterium]
MRATVSTVVLGSVAAVVANSVPASANTSFGGGLFPTYKQLPVEHAVGLTFDDGPGPGTEEFLKTLDGLGAKATFFVTGEQVA